MKRRTLLAGGLAAGSLAALGAQRLASVLGQEPQRVGVYSAPTYDEASLVDTFVRALPSFPEAMRRAKGGRVVLKPNLVEFHPEHPINTDPRLLGALVEAFRHHGAAEVLIAEGPGHHRDTELLLERTGLDGVLHTLDARYVDLNLDPTRTVQLPANHTGFGRLELGRTAMGADLLVSVAKMKTHHWVGATLTMKNLFGVLPGAVYGWPKNPLHYAGLDRSILDLHDALRPGLGVVDGVVGMEGDGPLMGDAVPFGAVVIGEHLPAVDATTVRLMGCEAERFGYLAASARLGSTIAESRIERLGDAVQPRDFALLPRFAHLRG